MAAYEGLKERGLRIPENVAVVGFDNQETIAVHLRPAPSTVALPRHEMGRWAVEYLIYGAARGETPPSHHAVARPYVERESVQARSPRPPARQRTGTKTCVARVARATQARCCGFLEVGAELRSTASFLGSVLFVLLHIHLKHLHIV